MSKKLYLCRKLFSIAALAGGFARAGRGAAG